MKNTNNKCLFILHPNKKSVTNYVRGLQFVGNDCDAIYLLDEDNFTKKKYFCLIIGTLKNLYSLHRNKNKYSVVVILKPWSLLVSLILLFIFKKKLYIDINDPLHLDNFIGEWKFKIYLAIFHKRLIFESKEYLNYCNKRFKITGTLIEDFSQYDEFPFSSWSQKKRSVIWFGNYGNSYELIRHIDIIRHFNAQGYQLVVLGPSKLVIEKLHDNSINFHEIKQKSRASLLNAISKSRFAFIPFNASSDLHTLRGNLKVKFAMAGGCCVLASNLLMHRRLINHGRNGFLFNDTINASEINEIIECKKLKMISENAKKTILTLGTKKQHFEKFLKLNALT